MGEGLLPPGMKLDPITGQMVPDLLSTTAASSNLTQLADPTTPMFGGQTAGDAGTTFGISNNLLGDSGGILGTGIGVSDALGLGKLFMDWDASKGVKARNKKEMQQMDMNMENMRNEMDAVNKYRAAYGA